MTRKQFEALPPGMLISLIGGTKQDGARVIEHDRNRCGVVLRYVADGTSFFTFYIDSRLYCVPGLRGTNRGLGVIDAAIAKAEGR